MTGGRSHPSITSRDLEHALAFRIHRTNRLLRTHLARFLARVAPGTTPEQWFVLGRLASAQEPVRQVDLAEPVLGDPPNVSRLVDGLVASGLVERRPDPADRRTWRVALTPAGRALANRIYAEAVEERRAVFAGFATAELDLLAGVLDRLDANVRELLSRERDGE